ncbi:MAG: biotin/lipoyl-containing protein, partial [Pseudomonadota bacterium]
VVHLFERDCSLQRRHQKVIEEAPAPGMTETVRAAMGHAAVEAARAIGYHGAGTVEFIADGSDGLRPAGVWCLEMNTRLQVEHPVSEAITGLDFVALQLAIAAGAPLPFGQDDLAIDGHSVEARIYAEDVPRGFLPATGRLHHLALPEGARFSQAPIRVDSGVRTDDAVTPHYDPMIAKLIAHGSTRTAALRRLSQALAETRIAGVVTNAAFLRRLVLHPDFAAGAVDTGLIERAGTALQADPGPPAAVTALAALAAAGLLEAPVPGDPWSGLQGWRAWGDAALTVLLADGEAERRIPVTILAPGRFSVRVGTETLEMALTGRDGARVQIEIGGQKQTLHLAQSETTVSVFGADGRGTWTVPDPLARAQDAAEAGDTIAAPMPGLVKRVFVTPGANVAKDTPLLVLEAMKMEQTLSAPRDGQIASVAVRAGDLVSDGAQLLSLEPEDD